MRSFNIPDVIVQRLPLYYRTIEDLYKREVKLVSSQELGDSLKIPSTQVRKDFSYLGRFGKQGEGYRVSRLYEVLRFILGLDHHWNMVLIGAGHLGRALLNYEGFEPQGFKIVACFDADPQQIGKRINGCEILDIAHLEENLSQGNLDIALVAVPPEQAQKVIDSLVKCGIKAILNYAPVNVRVPEDINIRTIDPVITLQMLTFNLAGKQKSTS